MFEQLPPLELQRCQRYEKLIGVDPDQEPLAALSVSPSLAVPEIAGADVFAGAVSRALWAPPPVRSKARRPAARFLNTPLVFPAERGPMHPQTKCLRDSKTGITSKRPR
jgi:hypothetical protein